ASRSPPGSVPASNAASWSRVGWSVSGGMGDRPGCGRPSDDTTRRRRRQYTGSVRKPRSSGGSGRAGTVRLLHVCYLPDARSYSILLSDRRARRGIRPAGRRCAPTLPRAPRSSQRTAGGSLWSPLTTAGAWKSRQKVIAMVTNEYLTMQNAQDFQGKTLGTPRGGSGAGPGSPKNKAKTHRTAFKLSPNEVETMRTESQTHPNGADPHA